MEIERFEIEGLMLFMPKVFTDDRGYFFESYNARSFELDTGLSVNWLQDNESFSKRGTLRGLHFQTGKYAQAKLVRVINGEVLDVAVDMRPDSPTHGHHQKVLLSGMNKHQFYIPRGFAHAFLVLSDEATFAYKVDNYYHKESDGGVRWNDSDINIDWPMDISELALSDKDAHLPSWKELFDK